MVLHPTRICYSEVWDYQGELIHILELAAVQVQRVFRGVRGRRVAERKRKWESAEPGPERLQLGMSLIEEVIQLK